MIMDSLKNIERYKHLHPNIFAGLLYLKGMSADVKTGVYEVSETVKVIVSEYSTNNWNEEKFEAHRYVIDIQYPLVGRELVQWSPLEGMMQYNEYDAEKDRTYYENPTRMTECVIGDGVFAVFFPDDAHNPQLAVDGLEISIKKATVKILISP